MSTEAPILQRAWASYSMTAVFQEGDYQERMFQEIQEEVARPLRPSLRCYTESLLPCSLGEKGVTGNPSQLYEASITLPDKDIIRKENYRSNPL